MSRDGSGTYSLPATMAVANQQASSTTVNSIMNDVASALTDSINKDGSKAFAANQSFGGNKATSLGAGTALTDGANVSQVQNGVVAQATTVGGTVDAITLNFTPAITAYAASQRIRWRSGGANTSATPTVNIDSLGAKTIKKNPGGAALVAGDLGAAGSVHEAVYNGTDFILLNPTTAAPQALGTADSPQFAAIELGAATDTTLARVSAGVISVEGNHVPSPASQAQGDVLYHNGTTWARLAAGTSGYFLKTNGTGANPAWAAGGSMTLLGTITTTSGSSASLGSLTLTGYKQVQLVLQGVNTGGSTTYLIGTSTSDDVSIGSASNLSNHGIVIIDLTNGSFAACFNASGTGGDTTITTASTTISIAPASGSFTAGSVLVYGVA